MNDLERFFEGNTDRLIHKWRHYFEIYDRHFSRFRGKAPHVVEFGVSQGGSMRMWKEYFGAGAKIYGVDINPHCKQFEENGVEIFIGDQESRGFLREIAQRVPKIDILIDDGGHTMGQQIATFEELFPRIDGHGVYLCEDMHTSYWPGWGGGYRKSGSFVEYTKALVDKLNAWHSMEPKKFAVDDFSRSAYSMHYYDSVLVIEKRPMVAPSHSMTGTASIPAYEPPMKQKMGLVDRFVKGKQ
ncbi:class I SAM-dependent methyltransferase [Lysobacter sp. KIS68-7]|uniref:class I SAM-dependent methyltransferase n=1 Tax=Lysobacter sp. KIS68-7 TaxID=2904252 RepID=UPI001E5127EE|nr:class I SAM-dependent methyltransferase [Lysobacter sp. KIS68-7]UHQ19577.1 class I SAM-dependent methyltransferase [Lysobacter sp. KIS68-7]